jgi:hypothetical protein
MRQWELIGITDSAPTWVPPTPRQPEPPLDPAAGSEATIVVDMFPFTLWSTDAALRFTSAPGTEKVGLRAGSTDVLVAFGPDETDVVDAHICALGGTASSFDLSRKGRTFRCRVSPVRASDGQVCGTICVGLELDGDLVFDPAVEFA